MKKETISLELNKYQALLVILTIELWIFMRGEEDKGIKELKKISSAIDRRYKNKWLK